MKVIPATFPAIRSTTRLHSIARSRLGVTVALAYLAVITTGCFSEQSYPMQTRDVLRIRPLEPAPGRYRTVREWLAYTEKQLEPLLPRGEAKPLLTDDLIDKSGKPVNVFRHFGVNPDNLQQLAGNYHGLAYTARLVSTRSSIDTPSPTWSGFEDVWIPVAPDVSLAGRLAFARRNGQVVDAPCIIILPGFFGDNGVQRTRDLATGLVQSGFHVLAVEVRGHGQTEVKNPQVPYLFGVKESGDLLAVSEWVQSKPHVISTGLIGYCWSGHTALLAAWDDARCGIDPAVSNLIAPHLPKRGARHHFSAGVIAFSPTLKWEEVVDWLDVDYQPLDKPIYAGLQDTIRSRKARKGGRSNNGNLRELIADEFGRSELSTPRHLEDVFSMLRLMPYKSKPFVERMHRVRVPVLIIQAADDPMIPAQWAADFVAQTDNTNVASIVLPSGGHVGFAAWAREFYFSLLVNFFDPARGAAAATYARYEIREFGPNDPRPVINACPPSVAQRPSASW